MADLVKKYFFGDKHTQLKNLLLKSCQMALDKGDYEDFRLTAHNFIWLYPKDKRAKKLLCTATIAEIKGKYNEETVEYFLLNISNELILVSYWINSITMALRMYFHKISGFGEIETLKKSKRFLITVPQVEFILKREKDIFCIILQFNSIIIITKSDTFDVGKEIILEDSNGEKILGDVLYNMVRFNLEKHLIDKLNGMGISVKDLIGTMKESA